MYNAAKFASNRRLFALLVLLASLQITCSEARAQGIAFNIAGMRVQVGKGGVGIMPLPPQFAPQPSYFANPTIQQGFTPALMPGAMPGYGQYGQNFNQNGMVSPMPVLTPQQIARRQAVTLVNQGLELSKNGNEQGAYKCWAEAIKLDPTDSTAWYNLTGAASSLGHLDEAVWLAKEYLKRFPNQRAAKMRGLLAMVEGEKKTQDEKKSAFGTSNADYLPFVANNGQLNRWNLQKMPLKVYIAPTSETPGAQPHWHQIIQQSFDQWSKATGGRIYFKQVTSAEESDIECHFAKDKNGLPDKNANELGLATTSLSGYGDIVHSQIHLLTREPSGPNRNKSLSDSLFGQTALHEIGHSLGLIGHSDKASDVMYFMVNIADCQSPGLSARDVNTMVSLYNAPQPVRDLQYDEQITAVSSAGRDAQFVDSDDYMAMGRPAHGH